jgi:hypothetical protein
MRSAPVYYVDGKTFCSPECRQRYLDRQLFAKRWQENKDRHVSPGND